MIQLTISDVDYSPEELDQQLPLVVDLIRQLPGDDRPDYWIAKARIPIRWIHENHERRVRLLVLAARWEGTAIGLGIKHLPVGIAFVTDETILDDDRLDFSKCEYTAIGIAHDTSEGRDFEQPRRIMSGRIGRLFGLGSQ